MSETPHGKWIGRLYEIASFFVQGQPADAALTRPSAMLKRTSMDRA
jgi:hypothetical protein